MMMMCGGLLLGGGRGCRLRIGRIKLVLLKQIKSGRVIYESAGKEARASEVSLLILLLLLAKPHTY